MFKKFIPVCAAVFLLSACLGGAKSSDGVKKRGEAKGGFLNLTKAEDLKVTTPEAFKGVDEVIIGGFTVGFATYKTDSAKAGGGLMGNGFGGKSTAKTTLKGIDDATMQGITNAAYSNFVADLKSKGIKVANRQDLLDSEDFKGTKTYENPYEDSSGGIFGSKSKTKYFAPSEFGGIKAFMGDIPGLMGGFAFGNPTMGAATFATKTNRKVISVTYLVDYANSDSYGGSWTSSSSVTVGQGITIVPDYTKVTIIGGQQSSFSNNSGTVVLGQPINSEKEFGKVTNTTSGASKGLEIAANVIGVLGGVGTNSSEEYDVEARPAAYKAAVDDALKDANKALVGKIATLK